VPIIHLWSLLPCARLFSLSFLLWQKQSHIFYKITCCPKIEGWGMRCSYGWRIFPHFQGMANIILKMLKIIFEDLEKNIEIIFRDLDSKTINA
jgi:hypothetical protein